MESLEACAGPPAIYFSTRNPPVGATALAILGKFLINFVSALAKKNSHSRGLLYVVAVCLRPETETIGTTSEAK